MEDWNDDFSGKVTLVTGGATGTGKAVALAFAMRGAKVIIADNSDRALDTVSLIHEAKGEATFFRTDVADAASVRDLVESSVERYGKVDIAFNNAGVLTPVLGLAEMNEDQFDRAISINLEGIFLCLKYEVQAMLKTGGGSIVNTASVAGLMADPGLSPYIAAKHGVIGLTKAAAVDYAILRGLHQEPGPRRLEAGAGPLR